MTFIIILWVLTYSIVHINSYSNQSRPDEIHHVDSPRDKILLPQVSVLIANKICINNYVVKLSKVFTQSAGRTILLAEYSKQGSLAN